jgi:hypothetical protein
VVAIRQIVIANDPDKTPVTNRVEADFRAVHSVIDRAAAHCAEIARIPIDAIGLVGAACPLPPLPLYSRDEYDEVEYGVLPVAGWMTVIVL